MNEYLAAAVDELYRVGVRQIVLSAGSRCTPLSMLCMDYEKFDIYMNIDERSAAFQALGMAKVSKQPVALICTSGSAPAHYLPAVTEAFTSRVPLLILSADRPSEMQLVGAPQTITQGRIFGDFVCHYEEMAIPTEEDGTYPRLVIDRAYMMAVGEKAPVHINIPIREPLVPRRYEEDFEKGRSIYPFQFIKGRQTITFDMALLKDKKGIVVVGPDADLEEPKRILSYGEKMELPILADPLSNLRKEASPALVDSYDAFLKENDGELEPEYVLLYGQAPVSKRLQKYIEHLPKETIVIELHEDIRYRNVGRNTDYMVQGGLVDFLEAMAHQVKNDSAYYTKWQDIQKGMREKLRSVMSEESLFEGKVVRVLQEKMPEGSQLLVSNSMMIRDMDYFWEGQTKDISVYGNRGTNGIDGTISTALGMATLGKPTVLLTGDLSFFHDMTAFLVGKEHEIPLTIVLCNNFGGGIFEYLPQKTEKDFEYLFLTPHAMDFSGLATLYGISHERITTYDALEQALANIAMEKGIRILEIQADKERSHALHGVYTTNR